MIKLDAPTHTFEQAIESVLTGITGNPVLKAKVNAAKKDIISAGFDYEKASRAGRLYRIQPLNLISDRNPCAIKNITKKDFLSMYETYFVPDEKPSRQIYDQLLNAAQESCPFCGGIGTPRNLDHFLPKSHFPQFTILPFNLVPSCRDCNMDGKAALYAIRADHQIIQPYLDNEKFFNDQWIFSNYKSNGRAEPGEFEYYVSTPRSWSATDTKRVTKHFVDFNIAHRYSIQAARNLGTTLGQIENLQNMGVSDADICTILLQPGVVKVPFANHWRCGYHQALIRYLS